jgi:transposase
VRGTDDLVEQGIRLGDVVNGAWEHSSQPAAISSTAGTMGCTVERLRCRVRRGERDRGKGTGPATHERDRIKVPERENRELRGAHAILRKASTHLARAELDGRSKP